MTDRVTVTAASVPDVATLRERWERAGFSAYTLARAIKPGSHEDNEIGEIMLAGDALLAALEARPTVSAEAVRAAVESWCNPDGFPYYVMAPEGYAHVAARLSTPSAERTDE